jgi:septum formation protein
MNLLLASGSPRRHALMELLAPLGVTLVVKTFEVDETMTSGDRAAPDPPSAYLERIVERKREACRLGVEQCVAAGEDHWPGWALVADTIVVHEREVLGKPRDVEEARRFLARLQATRHQVITRFALFPVRSFVVEGSPPRAWVQSVSTDVVFRALHPGELDAYAQSGEGLDKAGGYAIQGGAAAFVQRIEGSYSNVVGLPLAEVADALVAVGVSARQPR